MGYKKLSLLPMNVIGIIKDFFRNNQQSELEIALKDPKKNDKAIYLLRDTFAREEYVNALELVIEPVSATDELNVLMFMNEFPDKDKPAAEILSNLELQLRKITSYNMLVKMQFLRVRRIRKSHESKLKEIQQHIDNNDLQEAEILATPVIETMLKQIESIKTGRDIIKRIEPIAGFNNTRIIANPKSDYPTSISVSDPISNVKQRRALTHEEILDLANVAIHLLENVKSLDAQLALQLEEEHVDDNDTLGALLDTGLAKDVDFILSHLDLEPLYNTYLLPIEKTDVYEITRAIVHWIEKSIKQ